MHSMAMRAQRACTEVRTQTKSYQLLRNPVRHRQIGAARHVLASDEPGRRMALRMRPRRQVK